jgi:hypothetical protein
MVRRFSEPLDDDDDDDDGVDEGAEEHEDGDGVDDGEGVDEEEEKNRQRPRSEPTHGETEADVRLLILSPIADVEGAAAACSPARPRARRRATDVRPRRPHMLLDRGGTRRRK